MLIISPSLLFSFLGVSLFLQIFFLVHGFGSCGSAMGRPGFLFHVIGLACSFVF